MNINSEVSLKWKRYWDKTYSPGPPEENGSWYDFNAREIMFFLEGARTVVDTGCGSGEVLVRIAHEFERVVGIDYSPTMIHAANDRIAREQLTNVELYTSDLADIDKIVTTPVDVIYNSQVVQFLDYESLKTVTSKCLNLINDRGTIVFLNILDQKCIDLYHVGFYKNNGAMSFAQLVARMARYKLWAFRTNLFKNLLLSNHSIGYWYTRNQMRSLATELGCDISFYNAMSEGFGYRFHAVIKKKSDGSR